MPLLALIILMSGCTDAKISALKKEIERFNAQCPQDMGAMGKLSGVRYDDGANMLVYEFSVNEDVMDFSDLDGFEERVRPVMPALLSQGDARSFVKVMADCNAGFKAVYKGDKSGKQVEVTIPAADIKEMYEHPLSDEESGEMIVKQTVLNNKAMCPYTEEEVITMVDVFDDGKSVVFLSEIDEDIYNFDNLEDNMKHYDYVLRNELLSDPMVKSTIQYLSRGGRTLVYRYKGVPSGREINLELTTRDLPVSLL